MEDKDEILAMLIAEMVVNRDPEDPIDLVLCLSHEGKMAKLLSKYMLPIPLVAACPNSKIIKQLSLMNGVVGIKVPDFDSKLLGPDHLIKILLKNSKDIVDCTPGN